MWVALERFERQVPLIRWFQSKIALFSLCCPLTSEQQTTPVYQHSLNILTAYRGVRGNQC